GSCREDVIMHWLDTTIVVLLGVGATFGAMSGLLMQVARVVGLSAAVCAAVFFHEGATQLLGDNILQEADPRITGGVAYVLVFTLVYLTFHFGSLAMERALKAIKLDTMNRILGGALGAVKTAL